MKATRLTKSILLCLAILMLSGTDVYADDPEPVHMTLLGHSAGIQLPGDTVLDISLKANTDGMLTVRWPLAGTAAFESPVMAGRNDLTVEIWSEDMHAPDGEYRLTLTLSNGSSSDEKQIDILLKNDPADLPPSIWSLTPEPAAAEEYRHFFRVDGEVKHDVAPGAAGQNDSAPNYWTMTMGDLSDEAALWQAMMQPITILDDGKHTGKETYKLRRSPDSSTERENVVGEVTYKSQGVHVLETTDDGWAKVEVYNTSYGDQYKKNTRRQGYGVTAEKLTGYIEADVLKQVTPRDDYALIIDKLNQTMYIFEKGRMTGSLLVSTGLNNSQQSWNETPAGEFLIISKTGGFWAGNLYCDMGLLLNNGCLIHEVPSVFYQETGLYDYSSTEPRLGTKASHGCIRVQRKENAQGQSMRWLWNHLKTNTRVFIWDDATRYTEYPEDSTVLYYNTVGGERYHTTPNCSSVNRRYWPLKEFHYGELTIAPYSSLVPCKTCSAPARPETIHAANLKNGYPD